MDNFFFCKTVEIIYNNYVNISQIIIKKKTLIFSFQTITYYIIIIVEIMGGIGR